MIPQEKADKQKQLALEVTVRDCIQEIFRTSSNEAEANLGFDALQSIVTKLQHREKLKPVPSRTSDHIPGTENIDVHELTEAVLNDSEDDLLNKIFKGDRDAIKHFKDAKSRKTFAPSPKPVLKENHEANKQPVGQTEHEKAKKDALEKGELTEFTKLCKEEKKLFTPSVGADGKLRFTGDFRKMENRHV